MTDHNTPPAADPTAPAPPTRRRRAPLLIAAAVAGILAIAAGVWLILPSDEDEAIERCHDGVLDQLKSPATAEWAGDPAVEYTKGEYAEYYEVTGEVDAQNGFGALIRNTYSCRIILEDGDRWELAEVKLTD